MTKITKPSEAVFYDVYNYLCCSSLCVNTLLCLNPCTNMRQQSKKIHEKVIQIVIQIKRYRLWTNKTISYGFNKDDRRGNGMPRSFLDSEENSLLFFISRLSARKKGLEVGFP